MTKKIVEIILGTLMAFAVFFIAELLVDKNIHHNLDIVAILKNIPWPGIGLIGIILIIISVAKEKNK